MRLILLASLVLLSSSCFGPETPICTYRCDPSVGNNGACPDSYECRKDGYCHLAGSTGECNFAAAPDLSTPDLAVSGDMTGTDAATDAATDGGVTDGATDAAVDAAPMPDLAEGDLAMADLTPGPDLTVPPDLTTPPDLVVVPDLTVTCSDNVQNGSETDIDCGGPVCGACVDGKACLVDGDCQSMSCIGLVCMTPPDMSVGPDLAEIPDLSMPDDLSVTDDMAMTVPDDLTEVPDLTEGPDLTP